MKLDDPLPMKKNNGKHLNIQKKIQKFGRITEDKMDNIILDKDDPKEEDEDKKRRIKKC